MSKVTKIQKLDRRPGLPFGVSTAYPFVTNDEQVGLRFGVSEFTPGEVHFDLTYDEGVYVIEGEIEIDGDGATHTVKTGEFLWMPANRKIVYRAKKPCRFVYVIPT